MNTARVARSPEKKKPETTFKKFLLDFSKFSVFSLIVQKRSTENVHSIPDEVERPISAKCFLSIELNLLSTKIIQEQCYIVNCLIIR